MTPLHIEILLHYYSSPTPFPGSSQAGDEYTTDLHNCGLIDPCGNGVYKTTQKGDAHVEQLCQLPLPTQVWVGFDGKAIEGFSLPRARP